MFWDKFLIHNFHKISISIECVLIYFTLDLIQYFDLKTLLKTMTVKFVKLIIAIIIIIKCSVKCNLKKKSFSQILKRNTCLE